MTGVIATLVLILIGSFVGFWRLRKARKQGRAEERLDHAENVLERAQKAKNAAARLDDDNRRKLRERYGRK